MTAPCAHQASCSTALLSSTLPPPPLSAAAAQGIELSGDWVTEVDETGERVTSSLLDNLPISDAEKSALGGAVQK